MSGERQIKQFKLEPGEKFIPDFVKPLYEAKPVSTDLLGESWSSEDIEDARHIWSCIAEGVDCSLPLHRMVELEKRGLIVMVHIAKKGRYEFTWNDKLQELVIASKKRPRMAPVTGFK